MPLFAQKMFAQLDSFTLLALPYFILAGAMMSAGGMSQQLVDFRACWSAFSRWPGARIGGVLDDPVGRLGLLHRRRLGDSPRS